MIDIFMKGRIFSIVKKESRFDEKRLSYFYFKSEFIQSLIFH